MSGLDNSGFRETFAYNAAGMDDALQRREAAQAVGPSRAGSIAGGIVGSEVTVSTFIAGGHDRAREVSVSRTAS